MWNINNRGAKMFEVILTANQSMSLPARKYPLTLPRWVRHVAWHRATEKETVLLEALNQFLYVTDVWMVFYSSPNWL